MIVLGNQLALQFSVGEYADFLTIENFHYMRIAKNSGGLRPTFTMSFTVVNEGIIPYLNSGNIISLSYGVNQPVSNVCNFQIMGDTKNKKYHVGSTVTLEGAMYKPTFTSKVKTTTFFNQKSYNALMTLTTQNGFNFVSNASHTNDTEDWYQNGITDWDMCMRIAQNAYRNKDTFFAFAFDSNNFYFYDVKEHLKQGVKWILSVSAPTTNNIVNIGTYFCDDSFAQQNAQLAGQNVTNVAYNLDTGEITTPTYSLKTFTTMDTNKVNVNSTDCESYNYSVITSEDHAFSTTAVNQNLRNNILFSSYTVYVPVTSVYRDFKLLDTVQLVPLEKDREAEGVYIITGIAEEYRDQQYTIMLTLNRESANGIKGDLEGGA